eukprot:gene23298-29510_t
MASTTNRRWSAQSPENLSTLVLLESLNLKSNLISTVEDIEELSEESMVTMRIQVQLYISRGHQTINESFLNMEQHMESLQPDSRACKTPPLDFWITEKDIAQLSKDSSGTDVDSLIDQSKAYSAPTHDAAEMAWAHQYLPSK